MSVCSAANFCFLCLDQNWKKKKEVPPVLVPTGPLSARMRIKEKRKRLKCWNHPLQRERLFSTKAFQRDEANNFRCPLFPIRYDGAHFNTDVKQLFRSQKVKNEKKRKKRNSKQTVKVREDQRGSIDGQTPAVQRTTLPPTAAVKSCLDQQCERWRMFSRTGVSLTTPDMVSVVLLRFFSYIVCGDLLLLKFYLKCFQPHGTWFQKRKFTGFLFFF